MKKLFILAFITVFAGHLSAQYFIPGTDSFSKKKESTVITKDNTEHTFFYKKAKYKRGVFAQVFFEDAEGNEHSFMAEDILSLAIPPSNFGKLMSFSESTESIVTMKQVNFDDVIKKEFCYFEKAILPIKKAVPVLLQLVNPGFDTQIKVFYDPYAAETGGISAGGMQLTGGIDKSYYVKKGDETMKVTKGSYKKEFFPLLFGDCPEMVEAYGKKINWKDFAKHVWEYELLMSK